MINNVFVSPKYKEKETVLCDSPKKSESFPLKVEGNV
jgi:hypothetical protein